MDFQSSQLDAMDGNWKEASNSRRAGVFETWRSEEKILKLRQSHGKLGDIVVVQPEGALAPVLNTAVDPHTKIDQIAEYLDQGGEGDIDDKIVDDH